jgi:putative ABC transport system permease protein
MTSIGNILTMLAMVTMIISGFLVVNVIQTVVIEQKRQIGVIKSLGGTRLDIFSIYAGLAVTYGMLGTILAVILGIPLGFFLTDKLGKQFFVMVNNFDWSPKSVLMGASMGMGVPFLAAVWPVLNGTRVSILQALTDLGIKKSFGRSRLERWAAQLPLPITIRQAVANVVQKRSQLTLTLITLTLASAAFMGVTAVTISLIGEVNTIFKRMDYQIVVIPNQTQSQTTMESLMMEIDGVAQVVPTSSVSVEVHGDYTNFFTNNAQVETLGIDTTAVMFNFDFKSGGGWDGDANREGVVITSPMARQLGVKAGDNITLTIAGTIVTVPILGVDRSAFDFIYMEWHQLAQIAGFVQTPTSENSTEQQSPAAIPNAYLIRINKDHPTANDVDNIINALKIHLMEAGIDGTFQNQITKNKSITDLIGVFGSVMLVAAVLIGMVGAIGLLTMLTMGVFERQREIGVMRSIGAGSRTIAGQFLCEGLLVGLLAWVIGVPLSYLLAVMLNNTMGFETVDFRYRLSIPFIGLGSMLAVTILSSVGPSLAAARKTVSDILRYQ